MIYILKYKNGYYIKNSYDQIENANFIKHYLKERIKSLYYTNLFFLREKYKNRLVPDCILQNTAKVFATDEANKCLQKYENRNIPYKFELILTGNLKKKDINNILRDCKLKIEELYTIFIYLSKKGYKYSYYKIVKKAKGKKGAVLPKPAKINKDEIVEKIGNTTLSDTEIKNNRTNSNYLIARIFDNGTHWHCFLQTKFGVLGKEPGENGSNSHFHYISDRFGISKEDLIKSIKNGEYPSVKNHITIIDSNY